MMLIWVLKRRNITLLTKVCIVKAMVFPVVMYGCESWTIKKAEPPKNWCFQTVMLEKTLESPLDCKEIKPVNPKGNHSWIFIGRTDAEAETLIIWAPDMKDWLTGKDPDTEKDWRQEEKGKTEHEIIGWHHRLDGHEFEQAPRTGGAWWAAVYGVATSWTWLSNWMKLTALFIVEFF